jgi:hypothetical protein
MRRTLLLLVLVAACSGGSGTAELRKDGAAPTDVATAGTTGGAGTTGVAGTGAAGSSTAGSTAGTTASQDAATTDTASDAPAESRDAQPRFTGTVKMTVVGSSNEEGTCWRAFLWQKLRAAGITDFDFLGRNTAGPECGVAGYDKDCEAHGGTVVGNISAQGWTDIFKANPDIVLMHNGGADLLNGRPYMTVLDAWTLAIKQARMINPRVIYMAAQHTPQGGAGNVADVVELNAAMIPWAAALTTPESPVIVVDLFTGIDQKADTSDGTHLNVSGSQKVSDRWLAVLLPFLKP